MAAFGIAMQAALAALLETEMLHRIGDIETLPIDPQLTERLIEQAPGRAHKRPPAQIFFVARLLADHHHRRVVRSFAEHRLRCRLP